MPTAPASVPRALSIGVVDDDPQELAHLTALLDLYAQEHGHNFRITQFDDGIPQTTKANSAHHGFGSRSIRRITETYRGTVTFTSENDWFTVRVLLPRQAS